MCLEHVFGPIKPNPEPIEMKSQMFDQRPFLTSQNVGFADYGYVYIPTDCRSGHIACGLKVVFHGCGSAGEPDDSTKSFADANHVILLHPNVPGSNGGNNATESCNANTPVAGNCKEISRGCWDGYG
jgi:hypothetical protein